MAATTSAATDSGVSVVATAPSHPFYSDEKWKLSKKEGSSTSLRRSKSLVKNSSSSPSAPRRCGFTRKCAKLVKEQRARFYIMRRCVTMLICWRDYSDSWLGYHNSSV